ncbi:hypothetical protein U1Q18_018007 [Sarracenia purpurea var. burkii]
MVEGGNNRKKRRRYKTDDAGANKKPVVTVVKVRKLDEAAERAALGGDSVVDTEDNPTAENQGGSDCLNATKAIQSFEISRRLWRHLSNKDICRRKKANGPEGNTSFYELAKRAKDGGSKRRLIQKWDTKVGFFSGDLVSVKKGFGFWVSVVLPEWFHEGILDFGYLRVLPEKKSFADQSSTV